MHHEQTALVLLGQFGFVLTIGIFGGIQPALMVEEVPASVRCTAVALGYNVTLGVIGGLTPLVATWLVHRTNNDLSPAFMIMIAAAISFLSIRLFKENSRAVLQAA
jgi:MHS family proline/betaine transporter-like MFS transporter